MPLAYRLSQLRTLATVVLAASLLMLTAATTHAATKPAAAALAALPPTMLWAWERAEDLRWLPREAGVAYVAVTVELEADKMRLRRRSYPLLVRPDTALVPVVHVDAAWRQPPTLDARQQSAIVNEVLKAAAGSTSRVVQLDFEVRLSQRAFLLAVVREIRARLPADVALSATALASWCAGDYWIADLEADEVVPMAFRMARDDAPIRALLSAQGGFVRPRCSTAVGMATDEPVIAVAARRRYFFAPRAWDQATWRRIQ